MEQVLSALRAAGEPTRLRLLSLLARSELTVTELTHIVGQSQPRVSRHLKLLAESGLVSRHREGNWVFYRIAEPRVGEPGMGAFAAALVSFLPEADAIIQSDIERLETVRRDRSDAAAAYFRANADEWGRIQALHLPEEAIEAALMALVQDAIAPDQPSDQPPVDHLVDFGTGTGRMLEVLGGLVKRAIGVDSSPEMLSLARATLERAGLRHCQVRQGDIFALNLAPATADLITIHQVLHFLGDPGRAVGEAARILRPGGRVAVIDFAAHSLEFLRESHAHRRLGFADAEVEGWFDACGLKLEAVRKLPDPADPAASAGAQEDPSLTVCLWLARKGASLHTLPSPSPMEVSA